MKDWQPPKKPCNHLDPDGRVARCDQDKGHFPRTPHSADVNGHLITWGGDVREAIPASQRAVNSTMPGETERHAAQEIFTDGIQAERIFAQFVERGHAYCVCCGTRLSRNVDPCPLDPREDFDGESYKAALDEAIKNSHKHHIGRRKGHGFYPVKYGNDFGHDTPLLIATPVCEDCHIGADSDFHPGLMFSPAVKP